METFKVIHCAMDGELLESADLEFSNLSPKWLNYCSELLTSGPTFSTTLDGPLSTWRVTCTAGLCRFEIDDTLVLVGVVLRPNAEQQNQALLNLLSSPEWNAVLAHTPSERPMFAVADLLPEAGSDENNEALFQLAYHFAGAYLKWHQDANPVACV